MGAGDSRAPDLARLAATFRRWAEVEAPAAGSPIYERISFFVAGDAELLELASHARTGQPPPNMLYAAVHYLLDEQPAHPLAAFYPSLGGHDTGDAGPAFADFCRRNREPIIAILRSRMVQTNEVRRSALILPALATVAEETGRPLALIEIGPSAGLNLLFDRYRYEYGGGLSLGEATSPVVIDCEARGQALLLGAGIPPVSSRMGIDLNPLDVTDPADVRWLKALVWPEHDDRRALLSAAAVVAAAHPPRLLRGDVFELLPLEVRSAPLDAAVCVIATFVLVQFSQEMVSRLRALLLELSLEREIHLVMLVSNGFVRAVSYEGPDVLLWLVRIVNGEMAARTLAACNPHGRWIEWGATRAT